jgi:hypothetical protein
MRAVLHHDRVRNPMNCIEKQQIFCCLWLTICFQHLYSWYYNDQVGKNITLSDYETRMNKCHVALYAESLILFLLALDADYKNFNIGDFTISTGFEPPEGIILWTMDPCEYFIGRGLFFLA